MQGVICACDSITCTGRLKMSEQVTLRSNVFCGTTIKVSPMRIRNRHTCIMYTWFITAVYIESPFYILHHICRFRIRGRGIYNSHASLFLLCFLLVQLRTIFNEMIIGLTIVAMHFLLWLIRNLVKGKVDACLPFSTSNKWSGNKITKLLYLESKKDNKKEEKKDEKKKEVQFLFYSLKFIDYFCNIISCNM